jgi:hypothetical protein
MQMADESDKRSGAVLRKVEVNRREFVKSLTIGTAFAVPFIASYSMDGLRVNMAAAGTPDSSNQGHGGLFWFIKHIIRKLFYIFGHDKG